MKPILNLLSTRQARSRALLSITIFLAGVAILLLSAKIDALEAENRGLQRREGELAARLSLPAFDADAKLELQLPPLPAFEALARATADIQRLFKHVGLTLRDASHTPLNGDAGGTVGQVEIAVHLKGDYPAIKNAIAALLAEHDELALKSLTMNREQAADATSQIEVRFALFYRR